MLSNRDDDSALIVGSLDVWNGCRVGPWQTVRTFALLFACSDYLKMLILVFDAVWGRNLTLIRDLKFDTSDWCWEVVISPSCMLCFAIQTQNNGNDHYTLGWSLCVECVEWISCWTYVCLKRASCWPLTNRSYVCITVCVLELEAALGIWCIKVWGHNLILIMCYPMAVTTLRWSLFVECMKWVSCGPLTYRK